MAIRVGDKVWVAVKLVVCIDLLDGNAVRASGGLGFVADLTGVAC